MDIIIGDILMDLLLDGPPIDQRIQFPPLILGGLFHKLLYDAV